MAEGRARLRLAALTLRVRPSMVGRGLTEGCAVAFEWCGKGSGNSFLFRDAHFNKVELSAHLYIGALVFGGSCVCAVTGKHSLSPTTPDTRKKRHL